METNILVEISTENFNDVFLPLLAAASLDLDLRLDWLALHLKIGSVYMITQVFLRAMVAPGTRTFMCPPRHRAM